MKNIVGFAIVLSVAGGAFLAGHAVGADPKGSKFVTREDRKFDDLGGPKLASVYGDYKKGAYGGLMTLPAGFTSPLHTHAGAYEAVMIEGTSSHWFEKEDGSAAKKLSPGSYWSMPAKVKHVSACAPGKDCLFFVWSKTKFDFKDATPKAAAPKK